MTATTLDAIFNEAVQKNLVGRNMQNAIAWFRDAASQVSVTPQRIMKETKDQYGWTLTRPGVDTNYIGKMYLYNYDPKLKKELPYYDRFPLIFPIHIYDDGFLGLNMHYLPPRLRAIFMDNLMSIATNTKYNATTKLAITYGLCKQTSKLRYYKPCIKKYLFSHVRSQFTNIPAKHWNIALFLPLARFYKASEAKVWADSQRMV